MSDTRQLIVRIAAFRERLAQTSRLAPDADVPEAEVAEALAVDPAQVSLALERLGPPTVTVGPSAPPLTLRARQLLESARGLIAKQRAMTDDVFMQSFLSGGSSPLADYHRETVAVTESGLRLAQSLPESPEAQLRTCDGLSTLFLLAEDRVRSLEAVVSKRKVWGERVAQLARRLADVAVGRVVDFQGFVGLAEELLDEARRAEPLTFVAAEVHATAVWAGQRESTAPACHVAAHALNVAQVAARVVPHDYEWSGHPMTPVLSALLMDVGMLALPLELLAQPGPLSAEQRRLVATHPKRSSDMIRAVYPDAELAARAIAAHHERPDGTGYPAGLTGETIPTLALLLAACDTYAAQCEDRPYRVAGDPRTALAETLFAAEAGKLDRDFAEYLLHLSMYPVGTVVELTDGRLAQVVANHPARGNLRAAARPVVAVLTNGDGESLAWPSHLDLAASDRGGIVRALSPTECRLSLARHYPEFCG